MDKILSMTNEDYHAHPAAGSSGLKLILQRSPLHYWQAYLNPERQRSQPTLAMEIGTAWHCAVFEPIEFGKLYAAEPEVSKTSTIGKLVFSILGGDIDIAELVAIPDGLKKTTKEGKSLIEEIEQRGQIAVSDTDHAAIIAAVTGKEGRRLLPADKLADVIAMGKAAQDHPAWRYIAAQEGKGEASLFFVDPITQVQCKIRPDWHVLPCAAFPNGLIIDGKSTDNATPDEFARKAWGGDMALQAAFYVDGFQKVYQTKEPPPFAWLVQERDAPYCTAIYTAPADLICYGRKQYRKSLRILRGCQESGIWHGYPAEVRQLVMPAWAQKTIDTETKE